MSMTATGVLAFAVGYIFIGNNKDSLYPYSFIVITGMLIDMLIRTGVLN